MSNKQVIIVAAGKGSRIGGEIPKQFLLLGGRPVLIHSMEAFSLIDPGISMVLVLPEDHLGKWNDIKKEFNLSVDHQVVAGGNSRFQSVKNGLDLIEDEGLVAIHDGARPLILPETISSLFQAAEKKSNAIPFHLPSESIRIERKETSVVIDRNSIRMIQTPQVFDARLLKQAYQQKEHPSFTDDASVFEKAGGKIHLVECPAGNIKITRPEDLRVAEAMIKRG